MVRRFYRRGIARAGPCRPLRERRLLHLRVDDLLRDLLLSVQRVGRRLTRFRYVTSSLCCWQRLPLGPHTSLDFGYFELAGEAVV
jgi:hypothetical protein